MAVQHTHDSITLAWRAFTAMMIRSGMFTRTEQPRAWVLQPWMVAQFLTMYGYQGG